MEIIVGTYDELLLGYHVEYSKDGFHLKQSFTEHKHSGVIKCLATSKNHILASGSTDEMIGIINLNTRRDMGTLLKHSGTITQLKFFDKFLISTSEDFTINIWDTSSWKCLKTLEGHKNSVFDIAIHPSGRLALSCSKDKTIRTWDLINGKCAFVINKPNVTNVLWNKSGNNYITIMPKSIDIYSTESGTIEHTIETNFTINSFLYLSDTVLVVGGDEGNLCIYDTLSGNKELSIETQLNRVKAMECSFMQEGENNPWIIAVSSQGLIKIWRLENNGKDKYISASLIAKYDTKFRITTLAIDQVKIIECQDSEDEET